MVQMVCGTMEGLRGDKDMTSVFRRLLCAGRVVKEGGMEVAVCAAAVAKVDCSAA